MPQNIVDADVFEDPVQDIIDGESVNATNKLIATQDLSNRTRYLHNRLIGSGGSRTFTQAPIPVDDSVGAWLYIDSPLSGSGTSRVLSQQLNVNDAHFRLDVPSFGQLTEISVVVQGSATLPLLGNPTIEVTSVAVVIGAANPVGTDLGTVVDPSVTTADFAKIHKITMTGLTSTLSPTTTFNVELTGMNDAGFVADTFFIHHIEFKVQPI